MFFHQTIKDLSVENHLNPVLPELYFVPVMVKLDPQVKINAVAVKLMHYPLMPVRVDPLPLHAVPAMGNGPNGPGANPRPD
ncbi:hypothetical protein [Desulfosarcina sp.]|uniref:hypothetical protein n=1 Tax=Desulfosarcina sp. TaxID=2027861 RepID=UPI003970C330